MRISVARRFFGRLLGAIALLATSIGGWTHTEAAELVMFGERGCAWCARFEAEIGGIYPKTDEARRAPLRRVDLDEGIPSDLTHLDRPRVTPTFVLVDGGREVGRILGYPGELHFWGLLGMLLERLPEPRPAPLTGG
ncbi:MAG: hypothetical protein WHV64_03960 [Geminicoccaceae bacterium]